MRKYTICHLSDKEYSIHLGTDLFYSSVAWVSTYEMAVTRARLLAGPNGKVYYTEGLFQPKVEI